MRLNKIEEVEEAEMLITEQQNFTVVFVGVNNRPFPSGHQTEQINSGRQGDYGRIKEAGNRND